MVADRQGRQGAHEESWEPPPIQAAGAEGNNLWVVLAALMLATMLASLDQTVVATALPTIAGDLRGLNHLSWVVTAYMLTSTISTPLWGKLGDLHGRKRFFQVSIAIFLAGSALCGISQTMQELIVFRAIQGIGGGGLLVGAQAIIGDLVSARERGRYLGYFGAVFGFTSVAGPLLGGFFTQQLSWRWVFYVNIPFGLVTLVMVATRFHMPTRRRPHSLDYAGTALLSGGVSAVILMTTWGGGALSWTSPEMLSLGVTAVVLLGAFAVVETRTAEPLVPLALFRERVFTVSSIVAFMVGFVLFGAIVYIPLYLQTVHGAAPTTSGLELVPMVVGMLATFIASGRLITRYGRYKIFPVMGTATIAIGLYLLSLMTPDTSMPVSSAFMFVIGLGMGAVLQVLVIAVQNAVPYNQLGTATSAATFFRSIGGAFGVAVFGAIFNNRLFQLLPRFLPPKALAAISHRRITANPAQLKALPSQMHQGYVTAFSDALHTVFLTAVPFAMIAFLLTWLLKEVPLRDQVLVPLDAPEAGPESLGTNLVRKHGSS